MEYEHRLLHQFTMTVGGTRCYLWLNHSQNKTTSSLVCMLINDNFGDVENFIVRIIRDFPVGISIQ